MKKLAVVAFAVLLVSCGWTLRAQEQQQVQEAFPKPKLKATGTPKQALPTQVAGDAIPEDDQATPEQIDELMDVMRVEDQLDDLLNLLPMLFEAQQKTLMQGYEPQMTRLTAAQKVQVSRLNKKYMDKAVEVYPTEEMMKQLATHYQKRLNNGDVESMINFYDSEAGQHLLDAQPEIMKVFLPAMTAELGKRLDALKAEEKKEMDALLSGFKGQKK